MPSSGASRTNRIRAGSPGWPARYRSRQTSTGQGDARSKAMKSIEVQRRPRSRSPRPTRRPPDAGAPTDEQSLGPDRRAVTRPDRRAVTRPDRRATHSPRPTRRPPDADAQTDERPLAATDETPRDVDARVPIDELVPVMDPTADQAPRVGRYLADHPRRPPGIGGGAARRHATAEDVVARAIQPLTGRTSISRCRPPHHPGRAPATPS